MRRSGLLVALVLVAAANAVVLAEVAWNRSGRPDAQLELTERELDLGEAREEDSAVSLRLSWERADELQSNWFDRGKLVEVGFDCSTSPDAPDAALRYGKALARRTYAVLEYEGSAWTAWRSRERDRLRRLEAEVAAGRETAKALADARGRFTWAEVAASRLVPVDVGNDPSVLRQRHPDRHRYLITPAVVRLVYRRPDRAGTQGEPRLTGQIERILTDAITVPRDRLGVLAKLRGTRPRSYGTGAEPPGPRYRVVLAYGRRYEPWVVAVRPFEPGAEGLAHKAEPMLSARPSSAAPAADPGTDLRRVEAPWSSTASDSTAAWRS